MAEGPLVEGLDQNTGLKTDEYRLLGKPAVYRDDNGTEHAAVIADHNGEGLITGIVFDRSSRQLHAETAPLVPGPHIDLRVQPKAGQEAAELARAPCFWEWRPAMRLGSDVMVRATIGSLSNPKLPPNMRGVMPGKVVMTHEGTSQVDVLLFPCEGNIIVATGMTHVPQDIEQPGTCWIAP